MDDGMGVPGLSGPVVQRQQFGFRTPVGGLGVELVGTLPADA